MSTISVIIPVKNRAALLRKTLDNLLAQSMKPDEIIVVDDHSTDEIKLVIFDYITDCIFLNNKGNGPGAARNLGLSVATGKYIQFFDSDDLMTKDKLLNQYQALENSGADMAYGPYVQAQETENNWEQKDVIMQWQPFGSEHNLSEWMLRGWNCITQACLFKKEFLDGVPRWNETLITHEDYLYLFAFSLKMPRLVHVPDEAVIYRQHGQQSTDMGTRNSMKALDKMQVLTEMKAMLNGSDADFFSKKLFQGRLYQNYRFLKKQGVDSRRFSGFIDNEDFLWSFIYRFYNRQMRGKTNSSWEPMHGISADKQHYNSIIKTIA